MIWIGSRGISLFERNNFFYLLVRLAGEEWTDEVEQKFQHVTAGVTPKVDPTTTSSWQFYEYCCADDSVLTD
eukprot:15544913-Heterocapsa_arctica.AAC.1